MILQFLHKLHLYYALSVAALPNNSGAFYGIRQYTSKPLFETTLNVEIASPRKRFFIGGGSQVIMSKINGKAQFQPFQDGFHFNTGARAGMIEIGYEHFCSHPLAQYQTNAAIPYGYHGAYDKFYVKFSREK